MQKHPNLISRERSQVTNKWIYTYIPPQSDDGQDKPEPTNPPSPPEKRTLSLENNSNYLEGEVGGLDAQSERPSQGDNNLAETSVQTNPLADWADHWLVLRDGYRSAVGVAKLDKDHDSDTWYQKTDEWLYANYCEYSHAVGTKPIALRRFVNLLQDLCVNQLGLDVKHGRDRLGSYFLGLKIRQELDEDPLLISGDHGPEEASPNNPPPNNPPPSLTQTYSTSPVNGPLHTTNFPKPCDSKITARDGKVTHSVTDENRSGDKSQPCDGKIKNPSPTGIEESSSDQPENQKESSGTKPSKYQVGEWVKFQVGNGMFDGTVIEVLPNGEYVCEWSEEYGGGMTRRKEYQIRKWL